MIFNSLHFLIFFPTITILYFTIPSRFRWLFLLAASYFFYMSWKPEYIFLLLLLTVIGYVTARKIGQETRQHIRKRYLILSILVNIGGLLIFKYFNFINGTIRSLVEMTGATYNISNLDLNLPLGISYFTLLLMGYSIDVYHNRIKPENNPGIFALFISFFPQIAAGPIERARNMLPQFKISHSLDYEKVVNGSIRIAWGFFKKLVIADRLALLVNAVYNDVTQYSGTPLIIATYAFAFQIYCDFSAYSDIAIGAARILGFSLMENFQQPYFSRSVPDFWRKWHISLSTWLRDYIFFPLRRSMLKVHASNENMIGALIIPPMITMLISGLWHGANWTFIIWGGLHGLLIVINTIWHQFIKMKLSLFHMPALIDKIINIFITFNVISLSWIFFRANSISDALYIFKNMFVNLKFSSTGISFLIPGGKYDLFIAFCAIVLMETIHLLQSRNVDMRSFALKVPVWVRWAAYYVLILLTLMFGKFGLEEFIYIQF